MKNYGFIPDKITPDNYVFGGGQLQTPIVNQSGDWTAHLPVSEYQKKNGLETMNCTVFGTLNCIETLLSYRKALTVNYSERYIGVLAGTTTSGNSPHRVAEVIRANGLIYEADLPFSDEIDTWDKYYSPNPMSANFKRLGARWLKVYEFKHDWVTKSNSMQDKMMDALKYSPLGVAVSAWHREKDYFVKRGADNHWCELVKGVPGQYWVLYDSYDDTVKRLEWNYPFEFVKRYSVTSIKPTWWFVDLFTRISNILT